MRNSLKFTSLIYSIIIFVFSIGFINDVQSISFKAIHIVSIWEIPLETGEHMTFPRTPELIYSKEYEILREPYTISTSYVKVNSSGNQVTDKQHPSTIDTNYTYCISKKGAEYGMSYRSHSDSVGKPIKLDSLIKDFLHFPKIFYNSRGRGRDSIFISNNHRYGLSTEKFIMRKLVESDPDTSIFYFRKKPLDYFYQTSEKRRDNLFLYKAIIIYNQGLKTENQYKQRTEKSNYKHSFELTEIEVPDKEEVKFVIEKFKKSSIYNGGL